MPPTKLALAEELAVIRAEIARLKARETALASIEYRFPAMPVFRRGWPVAPVAQDRHEPAHA